ncbi:uncharacterized protein LOC131844976 isoform X2 [Achroia grisella]|uniref:uncharacterized protein LOC131844976 isoform X2 n=1 Tax=Achroia grisella TaxID=688607 RepID=UPI0027D202AB|nr:uncharacterized protein LOC131844976 isoform X2 [Achroia grisella]
MSLRLLMIVAMASHTVAGGSHYGFGNYPIHRRPDFHYHGWGHHHTDWGSYPWGSHESDEDYSWEGDRRSIMSTTTKTIQVSPTRMNGNVDTALRASSNLKQASTLDILLCLRTCIIRPEYRPVCGTDNMTYSNPSRLQCAINCGVDVALSSPGECLLNNGQGSLPTGRPQVSDATLSPANLQACIRSCPVTPEYNPVCGTDSVTYQNPGRLECAKNCGKVVSLFRPSRCPPPEPASNSNSANNNNTTSATTVTIPTERPITNPMQSSDSNGPNRFTSVVSPITNSPLDTTDRMTTSNGLDFSIPQNLLDSIFNNMGTTENTPDFSYDERFQDQ